MIAIDIPGFKNIDAQHLVIGFNGTLAIDGKLIEGTRHLLELISRELTIHILTADIFGTAQDELKGINCILEVLNPSLQDIQKDIYLQKIGGEHAISIGNGLNDMQMLKNSVLGIVVIQKEGASLKSLTNADIVCNDIHDALELLLYPQRILATLRN